MTMQQLERMLRCVLMSTLQFLSTGFSQARRTKLPDFSKSTSMFGKIPALPRKLFERLVALLNCQFQTSIIYAASRYFMRLVM